MFFGDGPLYNTILFYLIFVSLLLVFKPSIMYCDKQKRFKSFGCKDGETIVCFPLVCITFAVVLFLLFLLIDIVSNYLDNSTK